jgi:hypothetical protein
MQSSTMRRALHDGQEPRRLQRKKNGGVTAPYVIQLKRRFTVNHPFHPLYTT